MSNWSTVQFSDIADFKNGLNFKSGETGHALKVLGVGDFQNRTCLDQVDEISTVHTEKEIDSSYHLQDGDLVFVRSNGNKALGGRCMLLRDAKEKISFSGFTIRARLTTSDVLPAFVNLLMQAGVLRKELKRDGRGTNISNLNQGMLSKIEIPLISIGQQREILDFFNNWNNAIEKTEALIDAKERQFGWLQSTLIRANSDKWPTKPLNSLSHIKKGKQLNRDTLDDSSGYPVWNGGITPSGYTDKSNTAANTITISEGGNSCGFVNFCKEDFWLGGHCYAIEKLDTSLDPDFLFFCLKANERRIMRLRVGSGLPNIQKKDIEKLQIQFPPIDEQKSIAHTLNTAQQEITLLKKLANQYRTQKRGLMQKLLSGEWHIKNKEAA